MHNAIEVFYRLRDFEFSLANFRLYLENNRDDELRLEVQIHSVLIWTQDGGDCSLLGHSSRERNPVGIG